MADGALTAKQNLFAREYIVDFNATQAAVRAGYSEKTAYVQGPRLLENVRVQVAIKAAMDERSKRTGITADRVLRELAHMAYDDIKNYLSFQTVKTVVEHDKETGEPIIDYRTVVDMKDSDTIDTRNIQEISIGTKGDFKFKLYSKSDALVNLGRHLGLFTDKSEVSMAVSVEDYLKTLGDDDDDD